MTPYERIHHVLSDTGRRRIFWWRDDDTGANETELTRFVAFRRRLGIPVVISAVPAWLATDCAQLLVREHGVFVAQHGWDHCDHSDGLEKSIELGGTLPADHVLANLHKGKNVISSFRFERELPLLVPPWNRISDAALAGLSGLGFQSISTFAKDRRGIAAGLRHINCHVDPIVWREGKRLMTQSELADLTIRQLERGGDRPIGLLTHHLEMNDEAYDHVGDYLRALIAHPLVEFVDPRQLFGSAR